MKKDIRHFDSIADYNNMLGVPTQHPLVSVINLSEAHTLRHQLHTFSFYAVFLKESICGNLIYGCKTYDYQCGTVVCLAPGQVIGVEDNGEVYQPKGRALCFHPDLIRGTALGSHISEYNFFSYAVNEALHLSQKEREVFVDCLHKIQMELDHDIDRLSRRLISTNIELLLDYCLRFYERQFITREHINSDILTNFENLLNSYCRSRKIVNEGTPTVKWCAQQLCLSPNYFGDLIRKETGMTAQNYIQQHILDIAKEKLVGTNLSVSEISFSLGFQYPQHFSRLFKKSTGMTPLEFRATGSQN